nr:DUF6542 domain-containing protein [Streptomyces sp. KM273126]
MPNPRLTRLGGGLFCGAAMVTVGCLDRLLLGASMTVYGLVFLLVSALTAVWVGRGDLVTPPVVVPIAFAAGLPPVIESDGGLAGHLVGLGTALATQAGWLYGGTLVAGAIATERKIRLMNRSGSLRESLRGSLGRSPGSDPGRPGLQPDTGPEGPTPEPQRRLARDAV